MKTKNSLEIDSTIIPLVNSPFKINSVIAPLLWTRIMTLGQ